MYNPYKNNFSNLYKITDLTDHRKKNNIENISNIITELKNKNFSFLFTDVNIKFNTGSKILLKNIHNIYYEIFLIKNDKKTVLNISEFEYIFKKNKNNIDSIKYKRLTVFNKLKETIKLNTFKQINLFYKDKFNLILKKDSDKYICYLINNNEIHNISFNEFQIYLFETFKRNNLFIDNKRIYLKDFYIN